MLARCLPLLSAMALTSCVGCIDLGCINGFSWYAPVPVEWTAEEVERGSVRLCLNGACEERPLELGNLSRDSDGFLRLGLTWEVTDRASLADGDLVSLTLLASDGATIMGIAEAPVTYQVVEGICDVGHCVSVQFEGSTL